MWIFVISNQTNLNKLQNNHLKAIKRDIILSLVNRELLRFRKMASLQYVKISFLCQNQIPLFIYKKKAATCSINNILPVSIALNIYLNISTFRYWKCLGCANKNRNCTHTVWFIMLDWIFRQFLQFFCLKRKLAFLGVFTTLQSKINIGVRLSFFITF